jgi:hypothetical protein
MISKGFVLTWDDGSIVEGRRERREGRRWRRKEGVRERKTAV